MRQRTDWLIGSLVLLAASHSACSPVAERLDISSGVVITLPEHAPLPFVHAATCLQTELRQRYQVKAVLDSAPVSDSGSRVRVVFGLTDGTEPLWPDAAPPPAPGPDGYALGVFPERRLAVLSAGTGNGAIRGAFALADLTLAQSAGAAWPRTLVSDTPELGIRFARTMFRRPVPKGMTRQEAAQCELDWWSRWGLNTTLVPPQLDEPGSAGFEHARWYLQEARKRGMQVVANLGGRSLCAGDPKQMSTYLEKARRQLAFGYDGLVVLFDDLPSTRTGGHCERCIQVFGASLAREQRHILESLHRVLQEFGPDRKLVWCPTYYSLGMTGYIGAAEGPEAYFTTLAASPGVRGSWMFHCAFNRGFLEYLDNLGFTRRIWWYNGIRTQYYMVSRDLDGYDSWGPRLVIPGVKDLPSFFSPFENGWLMPGFRPADAALHRCVSPLAVASRDADDRVIIPPDSHTELREIGRHMDGAYFCGATTPYHTALMGLFATHPRAFDATTASRNVLVAMFGRRGGPAAEEWETAYGAAQLILARAQGIPLTGTAGDQFQKLIALMAVQERGLRTAIDEPARPLPSAVLTPLLDDMESTRHLLVSCAEGKQTRSP